jgi:magnesium transporter
MKTLTVFTVLIALPNVFYGMYGMNVNLPFKDAPWAFSAVVGFTIFLLLVVYLTAKRLRIF